MNFKQRNREELYWNMLMTALSDYNHKDYPKIPPVPLLYNNQKELQKMKLKKKQINP